MKNVRSRKHLPHSTFSTWCFNEQELTLECYCGRVKWCCCVHYHGMKKFISTVAGAACKVGRRCVLLEVKYGLDNDPHVHFHLFLLVPKCQQTEGAGKATAIPLDLHRKMGSWDITGKQINGVSLSLEPW